MSQLFSLELQASVAIVHDQNIGRGSQSQLKSFCVPRKLA